MSADLIALGLMAAAGIYDALADKARRRRTGAPHA